MHAIMKHKNQILQPATSRKNERMKTELSSPAMLSTSKHACELHDIFSRKTFYWEMARTFCTNIVYYGLFNGPTVFKCIKNVNRNEHGRLKQKNRRRERKSLKPMKQISRSTAI